MSHTKNYHHETIETATRYPLGYILKIRYWLSEAAKALKTYTDAVENSEGSEAGYPYDRYQLCLKKLNYFTNRQNERKNA
jgi:hypothetical protein